MLPKRTLLGFLAGLLMTGTALVAGPAFASSAPKPAPPAATGQQWVDASIKAQLARRPGGVVQGNTIRYAKDDVTLTYRASTPPGGAVPGDFAGCGAGEACVYTTPNGAAAGIRLSTGSLWCPWENAGNLLDLRKYGLADQVWAADNESDWWAEGIYSTYWAKGGQWKGDPHGILSHLDTDHITFVNVCLKERDLEY
jgi:hypothetical protein